MDRLISSIAADFSVAFAERFEFNEPADEYFDPISNVLGDAPTKDGAFAVLKSGIPRFTKELNKWLELELDEKSIRDIYHQALLNYYGNN